jgi:hypothetical protein
LKSIHIYVDKFNSHNFYILNDHLITKLFGELCKANGDMLRTIPRVPCHKGAVWKSTPLNSRPIFCVPCCHLLFLIYIFVIIFLFLNFPTLRCLCVVPFYACCRFHGQQCSRLSPWELLNINTIKIKTKNIIFSYLRMGDGGSKVFLWRISC